jgi:N-acetylglutamate synthase-like GNAT family acetyltransferase
MIRKATKYDKTDIVEMIQQFGNECGIEHYKNINSEHIGNLLHQIFAGLGVVFIEEKKGLLIGLITPMIWNPNAFMLHELAWYVKPEYRNGSVGYKLLKNFIEYGKELKQKDRIKMIVMGQFVANSNVKFNKLGFTKLEESWVL